jgi:8-oxo-dGTP pyrophosphatase MutT (NUDIX family)
MSKNITPTHCSNCNKLGHYFRECKEPVTSYGIIAYRVKQPETAMEPAVLDNIGRPDTVNGLEEKHIEFLMIQRKDTLGYVEFLRGKYNPSNTDYVQSLFNQMTTDELDRLDAYDFETLWNALWSNQISRQYKQEYDNALAKYNSLGTDEITGKKLKEYIKNAPRDWVTPEWGFPKGRRGNRESEIACAVREFVEETGLEESQFVIVKNLLPIEEVFLGGNRIQYRHRYFMAYCRQTTEVKIDQSNSIMNREIGDIGWYSYEKAIELIRPYNIEKRQVLTVANEILNTYIILPGKEYLKITNSPSLRKVTPFQIVERDGGRQRVNKIHERG